MGTTFWTLLLQKEMKEMKGEEGVEGVETKCASWWMCVGMMAQYLCVPWMQPKLGAIKRKKGVEMVKK